jgi:hypothetical protein
LNFRIDITGPNTSSFASRIDMFTSPNTVGSTQKPRLNSSPLRNAAAMQQLRPAGTP